jgi:predicted metalloprotease with PDZ domain
MYVVDRKLENCKVSFDVPSGWPLMLSLDADSAPNTFDAPSYDVLADAPVSTGPGLIIEQYKLHGKDHFIVIEGAARNDVDKEKLLKDCRFVTAAETDFFGSVPYHKYVWHFITYSAADGAGGLEHLGSTQISLASGLGPRSESVLAHEYFHLWNVKRTRAKVLGPFDYLTLPKTGALWWLEGVTDYYASLLPYRYQEWKREQLFDNVVRNMEAVRANPARLEISPYQASYRVAEMNNGRGNSNGYKISYYNLGWLAGMCLDIEIRNQTGNKHSLDDVTRALYDLCKDNKPGFEEDEIRKQCVRFGGPALGPFFDKVVMSPGELPIEEQLAKAGLKLQEFDQEYADIGFGAAPSREAKGMIVTRLHGPAEGVLNDDDVLTAINGKPLNGDARTNSTNFAAAVAAAQVGTAISVDVLRDGKAVTLAITPVSATRKVHSIVDDPTASPQAVALKQAWLMTKTPTVQ